MNIINLTPPSNYASDNYTQILAVSYRNFDLSFSQRCNEKNWQNWNPNTNFYTKKVKELSSTDETLGKSVLHFLEKIKTSFEGLFSFIPTASATEICPKSYCGKCGEPNPLTEKDLQGISDTLELPVEDLKKRIPLASTVKPNEPARLCRQPSIEAPSLPDNLPSCKN